MHRLGYTDAVVVTCMLEGMPTDVAQSKHAFLSATSSSPLDAHVPLVVVSSASALVHDGAAGAARTVPALKSSVLHASAASSCVAYS